MKRAFSLLILFFALDARANEAPKVEFDEAIK